MTALVVIETGEIVEMMSNEEASSITTQITVKLDTIADNYIAVMPMIRIAITRQAHVALGYPSPGAYVADRFGAALSRLGVDLRREVVRELSEAGLSTRAIAPVVGLSHMSVARELSGVTAVTPEPGIETAAREVARGFALASRGTADPTENEIAQARERLASDPVRPAVQASEAEARQRVDAIGHAVTGIDGKTYHRPVGTFDRKPPRKALVEVAKTRGFALREAVDSLMKVFADDRHATNEKQVADVLRGHLLYVAETVAAVIDQLP